MRSSVRTALRKLGCRSQLEAIAVARRLGLLEETSTRGLDPFLASLPRLGLQGYRLLAGTSASCLADHGHDRLDHVAQAWGRYLVARLPLAPPLSAEESVRKLAALLGSAGFPPQRVDGGSGAVRILLRAWGNPRGARATS